MTCGSHFWVLIEVSYSSINKKREQTLILLVGDRQLNLGKWRRPVELCVTEVSCLTFTVTTSHRWLRGPGVWFLWLRNCISYFNSHVWLVATEPDKTVVWNPGSAVFQRQKNTNVTQIWEGRYSLMEKMEVIPTESGWKSLRLAFKGPLLWFLMVVVGIFFLFTAMKEDNGLPMCLFQQGNIRTGG